MITLDDALTVFKKYGYNSKSVTPYLYKKNKEFGVCYSYIDSRYGITERVSSFREKRELDLFLKRLQWYKLNGKQKGVSMRLNNYEVSNPLVLYIRDNHVMSDDEMFNMEAYDKKLEKNNKLSHNKRLLVEAEELMKRYYTEKERIKEYTDNYFSKERELKKYYFDLQKLVDKYNKCENDIEFQEEKREIKFDLKKESEYNGILVELNNSVPKEDDIYSCIYKIWNFNKELELNKYYMHALRRMDDIDEELRLVVTKIDYMKELLSKKRPLFKVIDLNEKFKNIDDSSTYVSLYDDEFKNKYKDFIERKYNVIERLDEFKLAQYLNNFKTYKSYDIEKNVGRCRISSDNVRKSYDNNIEEINKSLEKQFIHNLSADQRAALILYVSLYRELFDMVMNVEYYNDLDITRLFDILKATSGFSSLMDECYNKVKKVIDLDINKDIKSSVFKNVNFDNQERFIESIVKNINIISNINDKMILSDYMKLYFSTDNFDSLGKDKFIVTSSIIAPYMIQKSGNYRVISAKVDKGIQVLFAPHKIVMPLDNAYDKRIELSYDKNPEIILDAKDIIINKEKCMIVYSRFKNDLVCLENYSYVENFEVKYKININKVKIEKREIL